MISYNEEMMKDIFSKFMVNILKNDILSQNFNSWKEITWSTKSKITKDEIGENVPNLENTGVILAHCKFVNNNCF